MKKHIIYYLLICVNVFLLSCGGGGNSSKSAYLKYANIELDNYEQVNADIIDGNSGKEVMWFIFADYSGNPEISKRYKEESNSKIDIHPAIIKENESIELLINDRFEIQLNASNDISDYKNTEKLREFIQEFNITALHRLISEDRLTAEHLKEYIPKLSK